jgi:hypothetical protein
MARGCCLLEFLRRDATFSESLHASTHGHNPLIPTPSTPSTTHLLPPLPPAPRIPGPSPSLGEEGVVIMAVGGYLKGFQVAVDVMDQAMQAILASAVVRCCGCCCCLIVW